MGLHRVVIPHRLRCLVSWHVAHGAQLPKGYVTRKSTPPFRSFVRAAERTTVMDEVRSVDASREASATSREASR